MVALVRICAECRKVCLYFSSTFHDRDRIHGEQILGQVFAGERAKLAKPRSAPALFAKISFKCFDNMFLLCSSTKEQ